MGLVKKFSEVSFEDLEGKKWFTSNFCVFHYGHPMRVVADSENKTIKFVCTTDENNYFVLDKSLQVEQIISDTTAYLTRKVEKQEIENYLQNLKLFSIDDLVNLFETTIDKVIHEFSTPFNIRYSVKSSPAPIFGMILVEVVVEYNDISEEYHEILPLCWTAKGVYIPTKKYDVGFKQLFLSSKQFESKLTKLIRTLLSDYIDKFNCNYDHIRKQKNFLDNLNEIGKEFGFKFERHPYYYASFTTKKEPNISITVCATPKFSVDRIQIEFENVDNNTANKILKNILKALSRE